MLRDLVQHKAWASAVLLKAIRQSDAAARNDDLRALLHHIILANRFWLSSCRGQAFDIDVESRIPESLDTIADQYQTTHAQEWEWIVHLVESDLARVLEGPLIPGQRCSVGQAYMQVCMHSQGHRSQCATRLRILGGEPPATDFILWLKDRPSARWA